MSTCPDRQEAYKRKSANTVIAKERSDCGNLNPCGGWQPLSERSEQSGWSSHPQKGCSHFLADLGLSPSTLFAALIQWLPPAVYFIRSFHPLRGLLCGRNKCPFFGEQSVYFSPAESNEALLSFRPGRSGVFAIPTGAKRSLCHFDRSAAEWRNLADNWTDFSVRDQIPPLRNAAPHFGPNDKIRACFFRRTIACSLRAKGSRPRNDKDAKHTLQSTMLRFPIMLPSLVSGHTKAPLPLDNRSERSYTCSDFSTVSSVDLYIRALFCLFCKR